MDRIGHRGAEGLARRGGGGWDGMGWVDTGREKWLTDRKGKEGREGQLSSGDDCGEVKGREGGMCAIDGWMDGWVDGWGEERSSREELGWTARVGGLINGTE